MRRAYLRPHDLDIFSHEVSHPVEALGLLSRALRHRRTEGEFDSILNEMELGLAQLRQQLASFFDVVRAEECLRSAHRSELPLMPVFEKLALQTGRMAHDARVRLTIVPTRARVISDRCALGVILHNLVVTRLFATRGDRVLVGCRNDGDTVRIEVWENGDSTVQEHQTAKELSREFDGNGASMTARPEVGLLLMRELAQSLGHHIQFRSEQGLGPTTSLTLPRAPGEDR
jgi:histidine kinase